MSDEIKTARLLRALGISPDNVERVTFDHQVGGRPTIQVWFVPNREQYERFASDLTEVYQLEERR